MSSFDDLGAFRNIVVTPVMAAVAGDSSAQISVAASGGMTVDDAAGTQSKVTQPSGISVGSADGQVGFRGQACGGAQKALLGDWALRGQRHRLG